MTRKRRSPKRREAICIRCGWMCHICGTAIDAATQGYALDHIIPLMGGGSDDDDNLAPVHNVCHARKTAVDVKAIAKGKRVRAKRMGLYEGKGRPMVGTVRSGWKRLMNGQVVRR